MKLFLLMLGLSLSTAGLGFTDAMAQEPQVSMADPVLGWHTTQAAGEKRMIVIFVDFPDLERYFPLETIGSRILDFVSKYFFASSYGAMSLKGETAGPYVLPHPVSYYRIAMHNLDVDPRRVLALIRDATAAADADVTFTEDSYVVLALGASHREYGMVGLCGYPGMLGWSSTLQLTTPDGEPLRNVAIFCENAHLGTYVHDIVHMLGGVDNGRRLTPCLYDHDLQALQEESGDISGYIVNMGYWDPMSSHFPYDMMLPPAGLSSWTKMRLGWIDRSKISVVLPGETATVRLDPLSDSAATTLVIKIPLTPDTFYLVENRQSINSDQNLPSSGIVILYCDDTVSECRHGSAPVRIVDANPRVAHLLDAAFGMETKRVFVDLERDVSIVVLGQEGMSYDLLVSPPVGNSTTTD